MEILYLAVVFLIIVFILALRKPLYAAILAGLAAAAVLYGLSPYEILKQTGKVFTAWSSLQVLLSLYLITFLQRMMESKQMIRSGREALNGIFHNPRVNAGAAPIFIGLLPSAAAMILCADMVKESTDGYLKPREQAFLTSWMRHLPECMLPTNPSVLLMISLSGVSASSFMLGMLAPAFVLALLVYIPYLRRLPRTMEGAGDEDKKACIIKFLKSFWPLVLIILLLMVVKLSVVPASLLVLAAMEAVYRFTPRTLWLMMKDAFETKVIVSTFLLLVLKEFLDFAGVIELMPGALSVLPVPVDMVFVLLFFFGTIVSGSAGAIALGMPLALAAIDGGLPLAVLLMGISHGANQLSPVHICLEISASYYDISMGELIRKSVIPVLLFCSFMLAYYKLLLLLF